MGQLSFFDDNEGLQFPENLLAYYPVFLEPDQALVLLEQLITTVPWQQQPVEMYGKILLTPRLSAWFGDNSYAATSVPPLPWTPVLQALRERIQSFTGMLFNSVLLNYYRDGNDSVAWHSDNEKELGERPNIASLSLGQPRKFEFRYKNDHRQKYALQLGNGSLLIMKGNLQHHWEHRVPKSPHLMKARINLTFRIIQ